MLVGIFVGGRARRMGGQPKGLLPAPDTGEPLVARTARIAREVGLEPVLVGEAGVYAAALPGLRVIPDRPAAIGPLGGLAGLLHASEASHAIAIACDMPYLTPALLARLRTQPARGAVLAPRSGTFWEPLCARYAASVRDAADAAIARGLRSPQQLLGELVVEELALGAVERRALVDWDAPEDLTR